MEGIAFVLPLCLLSCVVSMAPNHVNTAWDLCSLTTDHNLTFIPADLRPIVEGTRATVHVLLSVGITNMASINVTSSDERVTKVQGLKIRVNESNHKSIVSANGTGDSSNQTYHSIEGNLTDCNGLFLQTTDINTVIDVDILGLRLGKSQLSISVYPNGSGSHLDLDSDVSILQSTEALEFPQTYPVVVLRSVGLEDNVFHITMQVLLAVINFSFGCDLDLSVVIAYLKRPLAPSLGFCSQFIFMPLLGLAITLVLHMDPVFSIGLISLACSPGGGASNAWTILLGGDINLSLTMTFVSLTLALGMMPLWMFLVTRIYFQPEVVQIPYLKIFTTLCYFVGPCFLGLALRKIKPKFAEPIQRLTKPLSVIFLVWVLTFGTYVNFYMWQIMREVPITIAAGILLPWCGFAFGLSLALLFRQGRQRAIAISIETGIQNLGIPIILLQRSFPQPEGDLAATIASSVGIFTPLPLFLTLIILTVRKRCRKASDDVKEQSNIEAQLADDVELDGNDSSEVFIKATNGSSPEKITENSVVI